MFNGENYLEKEVVVGDKCERRSDRKDWKRWLEGNFAVNMEKSEVKFWRGSTFPRCKDIQDFYIHLGFEFSTKGFKISASSWNSNLFRRSGHTEGMGKSAAHLDKYRAACEKVHALDTALKVVTDGARRRAAEAVCRESVAPHLVGYEDQDWRACRANSDLA
jgi:hypothetical protein